MLLSHQVQPGCPTKSQELPGPASCGNCKTLAVSERNEERMSVLSVQLIATPDNKMVL